MFEHSSDGTKAGPAAPRRAEGLTLLRDGLVVLTIMSVAALDQLTKYLVKANLAMHESWPAHGWARLTRGSNSGTAFGLFPDQTFVLILASLVAIGFLYYFYRSHVQPGRLLRLSLGLQLGGAIGNLVDRLRSGTVVDFIDIGPWPVFNLADSAIVVGITILVMALTFGGVERDARRTERPEQTAAPEGPADGAAPRQ